MMGKTWKLLRFRELTGTSNETAKEYLMAEEWVLSEALRSYRGRA